ncbi:MAG: efflux RND transporter periplasmic adaptor subunit, partial [Pseudomonadota bacterium]
GLFLVLFVPMQWGAPSGAVNNYRTVMEIIPNVTGEVISVEAAPLQDMQAGEPIFTIDPVQYEARVSQLEGQLALSAANLARAQDLMDRNVGRQLDVDIYQAEVDNFGAQLEDARWQVEQTVVRAPAEGRVVALTLRPGQRVANLPLRSWVAYATNEDQLVVGIPQSRVRYVERGQEVEVVLRMYPGQVLAGKVDRIVDVTASAQLVPNGLLPTAPTPLDPVLPFGVVITLDDEDIDLSKISGGATGTAAIYTQSVTATHVIRRVMIRMEAWMNYLMP